MIKFFKRIFKNIEWSIFNHPPINISNVIPEGTKCKYCKAEDNLLYWQKSGFAICCFCMEKAYDKILKKDEKNA